MSDNNTGFTSEAVSVTYANAQGIAETYAAQAHSVTLDGRLLRGPESQDTAILFIHPAGVLHHSLFAQELARRGAHVLCGGSRYPFNDTTLIMENVLLDLGAWMRFLREDRGYANVVIAGWSGGGAVAVYYQSQAERPTVTETPAGDPVDLSGLLPAQAVLQLSAHVSRAVLLTESIDPSITDERDPFRRDPALNLYMDPATVRPPYDPEFIATYRTAQLERNRRISAWAKETLADLRKRGGPAADLPFITFGTLADPRWLDPSLEPNGRTAGTCYLGDPAGANDAPTSLGRFSTLRSWLSQWSIDDSNASTEKFGKDVTVPSLVVTSGADNGCPPSHADRIVASLGGETTRHNVTGASHYYIGQPEQLDEAVTVTLDWLHERLGHLVATG